MKAAVAIRYGGPEVLKIQDVPIPRPDPNQILVRVRAIGLNFADVVGRWGVYPGTPRPPFVPGIEFSGDVVAVGSSVMEFTGRERVMGYSRWGSHAEYLVVNKNMATVIPASMSYEEGAAFLVTNLTAYHGLVRLANIRQGEKLLVHAAGGGVGTATVQLAHHLGAEIFATAGTPVKLDVARAQGAHHVMNYRSEDYCAIIKRQTENYGVDVVMDSVGGRVFRKSWQLLAPMGRYVLFGISALSGTGGLNVLRAGMVLAEMRSILVHRLISANRAIFGFNLGTIKGKESYFREAVRELIRLYQGGHLKPVIGSLFSFRDIQNAHRALQTGRTFGKVVVTVVDDQ